MPDRRWRRIGLVVVALLLVAAVIIFWPVSEDLSYLADAGQGYDVQILRDTWGVPHVFGQTDADVAYGLAYAHAEDDFLTIQQALAAARGHLARIYGPDAAPNDYMVQLLRLWDTLDAGYESGISPEMRANLDAYADGLNYYAALHQDEALPGLFPVRGKDVAAGFMHKTPLFFGLDSVLTELFAEERQREISSGEVAQSWLQILNISPSVVPGTPAVGERPVSTRHGSNTFAVGPARSANGDTFLAVNSHQPWEGPVTWYEAHLHSEEGLDTAGALFPGAPSILHGHNRDLGWAFTVNSPDLADVYVLEINPDDPDQYRFDGRWLDLDARQAPITVKLLGRLSWTVRREVLWSVYGPTVRQDHGTYAIRYAGMGEVGLVEQFFRLNKARNLQEWQQIMAEGPLPMFNAGYADKEGNVYYLYNAKLPVRAEGYDWEQYLPGNTSQTLWTEYLPSEQLPQVLNPPSGFVQNANSTPFQTTTGTGNPDPAGYSPTLGIERHMSNRALRALELFGGDESITADEFETYKYDVSYSTDSDVARLVAMVADAPVPEDPDMQAAIGILDDWDLRTNPESRGATLAILTLHFLNESDAADISPSRLVGNEVSQDVLMDSLGQAVDSLVEHFGRVDVPWEEVNRLQRGDVDLGLGGGPDVLHAVYGELQEDGRFRGFVGDSYVMLVTWDANGNVSSRSIHQYGSATLDEASSHYADQAPLFANRKLKPVWLDESDIRDHLERAYRPGEEAE